MLKPLCPHCQKPVSLLLPDWQARRNRRRHACPFCKGSVEVKFKGSTYAMWFAVLATLCGVARWLFGAAGFGFLFTAALVLPLAPSIYLESAA